jgi:hypothetical protein
MKTTTTIEMTAEGKAAIQPVANRLARLVAPSATYIAHDAIDKPASGSLIGKAWKTKLTDAYEHSRMRLDPAEDHFRTILTVLTAPDALPNFSLFTLVRGAAVPTMHARYLADPAIDETARLARGLSARLINLEQQQKVHPEVQGDHFAKRVEHLRERAEHNGIEVVRNKNGAITGFGENWPSDTMLSEMYIPVGKTFFQYVSGYGHSLPWAIYPTHRAQESDDPDVLLVPTDVNVPVLAAVLNAALGLYDETIGFLIAAAGYPSMVWEQAKKG